MSADAPAPPPPRRPPPSRGKKLAALFGAPLVLLLLVEGLFWLFGYDPRPAAEFGETGQTTVYATHPRYFWTLRPNDRLHARDKGIVDVRTNSLGIRGPEIPPAAPDEEEIRILCLGDSITFGLGLLERETWPAVAARQIEALSGRRVTMVNAAIPGWASLQGKRLYEDVAPGAGFDFVVFWFGMNDAKPANSGIPDRLYRYERGPVEGIGDLLSRSRIVSLVRTGLRAMAPEDSDRSRRVSAEEFRSSVDLLTAAAADGGPVPIFVRCPEQLAITIRQFEALREAARGEGIDVLFGPPRLFSPYGPFAGGDLPPSQILDDSTGRALWFRPPGEGGPPHRRAPIAEIEQSLAMLRGWKATIDRYGVLLPADALDAEDLLGDLPPDRAFTDNCHLTAIGAERAGGALAAEILRRTEANR